MKRSTVLALVVIALFGAAGLSLWLAGEDATESATAPAGKGKPLFYRHPMTPSITSPVPAKDDMGMAYIPVYAGDAGPSDAALVSISAVTASNLGVRTEPVLSGPLARAIDTVGYVDFDERLLSRVNLRVEGWIEELQVRTLGARVSEGDLLFKVYSPELRTAQREFLQSAVSGSVSLRDAGAERLEALGMNRGEIERLHKIRQMEPLVAVYARQDGVVAELNVREGMFVTPGTTVMTLAGLESVWVLVDIFPQQADWVEVGQTAEVRLPHQPSRIWKGKVEYIYPQLDPKTRTLKARLRFPNPEEILRPNMYASVTVHADPRARVLSVPVEAVIRTGAGARVILAHGDGRFDPVPVQTGIESEDRVEILEGLARDDRVVVSAQFLLDSEASLQASMRRMTAASETSALAPTGGVGIAGTGSVNRVDVEARTINLSHDPIPDLNWSAMTMDFAVAEGVSLTAIEPGQPIRFRLRQTDAGPVIIELERAE